MSDQRFFHVGCTYSDLVPTTNPVIVCTSFRSRPAAIVVLTQEYACPYFVGYRKMSIQIDSCPAIAPFLGYMGAAASVIFSSKIPFWRAFLVP